MSPFVYVVYFTKFQLTHEHVVTWRNTGNLFLNVRIWQVRQGGSFRFIRGPINTWTAPHIFSLHMCIMTRGALKKGFLYTYPNSNVAHCTYFQLTRVHLETWCDIESFISYVSKLTYTILVEFSSDTCTY